jgi:hypothetical protein
MAITSTGNSTNPKCERGRIAKTVSISVRRRSGFGLVSYNPGWPLAAKAISFTNVELNFRRELLDCLFFVSFVLKFFSSFGMRAKPALWLKNLTPLLGDLLAFSLT